MSRSVLFLAIFRAGRSIAAGAINVAFPYLVLRQVHQTPLVLGFLYTTGAIGTAVIGFVCGFLADAVGRKAMLGLVSALLPASALLVYASGHPWALFFAAFLGGYSATGSLAGGGVGGAAMPIQSAVLADVTTPEDRTAWFARLSFLSGVAGAAGALVTRVVPVRLAFLAACYLAAAGTLAILPVSGTQPKGDLFRLRSAGTIGKFTLTGVLNGFSQGLVMPFLIPFFVIVYHLPMRSMAVDTFLSGLAASSAMLLAPRLERAYGFVGSVVITRGASLALMVLFPLVRALPVSVAIYILAPALRVVGVPIQQSVLTEMVLEEERSRALSINQVARLASASAATAVTGYLFHIEAIGVPFYLYGGLTGGNLVLYQRFFGDVGTSGDPVSEFSPRRPDGN